MTQQYKVVGACALITQDTVGGPMKCTLYRGVLVGPGAKPEEIRHNLEMGLLAPVAAATVESAAEDVEPSAPEVPGESGESGDGDDSAVDLPADGSAPKPAANKATWVEYAVSQGMDRDEAAKASKKDLVEALKR
jgi:hypothetical protein